MSSMHTGRETIQVLHVGEGSDHAAVDTLQSTEEPQFVVETATGVADGLSHIETDHPDCVISGYDLPEQNGVEFLRCVRHRWPDLPFILFTANGDEAVASKAISADVTEYLRQDACDEDHNQLCDHVVDAVQPRQHSTTNDSRTTRSQPTEAVSDTYGWELDLSTDEVTLTPGAQTLLNRSDEPTVALETALELFHPDERPKTRAALNRAAETHKRTTGSWEAELPDGDQRVFDVIIDPIPADDTVQKLQVTLTDLPVAADRRQQCDQFEAVCAHTQNALFLITPGDRFTIEQVNQHWDATTGIPAEQAVGRPLKKLRDTPQGDAIERCCKQCLDRRQPVERRHQFRRENDSNEVQTTITPVRTDGEITHLVGSIQDVSADEQQQELHELRQAIDTANVAITLADPAQEDNPLVYVNDAFETLTGYSTSRALGENCRYLQGPNTDETKVAALREAIDNEEPITVELRNYRKDGTEFWNRLTVTPIYDDDGTLIRYLGTQQDVTERKESKQELQAEREFTQQALDSLDDLFYVLDTDGTIQRWNDRLVTVTGYTPTAVADMEVTSLFPKSEQEPINEAIETAFEDGSMTVTATLRTKDGETIPFEWSGARLTDTDDETIGLVGIGRDISQRREREQRFQALVEGSNDSISVVDADGRFQYQSPSIEHILGYDHGDVVGNSVWEYIHPDDHDAARRWFESVVSEKHTPETIEYRARHADGSWQWMEASGNDQINNSAVSGYVITSRRITARKQREQHLSILDRVLRHNFRNDMNVIRGRAEAIRSTTPETAAEHAVDIVAKSDELLELTEKQRRLTSLIRDDPVTKKTDLEELLEHSISTVTAEYPAATVTTDCPTEAPIHATTEFEQAITELVTNAIVHNDADTPAVAVSAAQTAEVTHIDVADNGPPLPEVERNILTEKLQETPLYHGSGLGLWLVRLIVSQMGGTIYLNRNDSGGNTVRIELPR